MICEVANMRKLDSTKEPKTRFQPLNDAGTVRMVLRLQSLNFRDHCHDAFPCTLPTSCPFHWCLELGWMASRRLHPSILQNEAPTPGRRKKEP